MFAPKRPALPPAAPAAEPASPGPAPAAASPARAAYTRVPGDANLSVRPADSPRPAPSLPREATETRLGPGTQCDGILHAAGPVRIQGGVTGEVHAAGQVHVERAARVQATLDAPTIQVDGTVEGRVTATGRLEVAATGRVSGEIQAGTLVMHEGAVVDGRLHMGDSVTRVSATDAAD